MLTLISPARPLDVLKASWADDFCVARFATTCVEIIDYWLRVIAAENVIAVA